MVPLSQSYEYLLVFHNENFHVIFLQSAPNLEFDANLVEEIRQTIARKQIIIPQKEGQIGHAQISNKYLIMRAGKYSLEVLVIGVSPTRPVMDALKNFGVRFEARWGHELETLYSDFKGDISIFLHDSDTRPNVQVLFQDIFQ
ncbi:hypothetical protein NEF87_000738 [Candidatus Lokiarchaeum ossiferum]|uniref:Uncharacterized protein n=1 Tax=Candidatus Lokiarchaeum ossiferum TaxID=2951803 RepID=A0ABY6HLR1_9ARCH|nr:hypothetical protein NEF87_000738 [Candidatus Lokiarchaeum sp. B-35]